MPKGHPLYFTDTNLLLTSNIKVRLMSALCLQKSVKCPPTTACSSCKTLNLKKFNLIIPPNAEPPDEAVKGEQHKKDVDDDQLRFIEGEGDFLKLSTICVESKDGADNLLSTRRCSAQVQRRLPVGEGLHKNVTGHLHFMANGHAWLLYACGGKKLVAREALSRQFVSVSESFRKNTVE